MMTFTANHLPAPTGLGLNKTAAIVQELLRGQPGQDPVKQLTGAGAKKTVGS
jgi:hypothetical protein